MNCTRFEELISDYLENQARVAERAAMDAHRQACSPCSELVENVRAIMDLERGFPVYSPPEWLATKILANTPRLERETWLDTLRSLWGWLAEPRTAMALFAATLVIGWMSSALGVAPYAATVARDPYSVYYDAGDLLNQAYDGAVRIYHRAPLVTRIQAQIERFRETSS